MVRSVLAVVLMLTAFVPRGAAAQEALTLDAAVRAAITHNASLRSARASTDEAAARLAESRSGFFPRVSFSESWQRGNQPVLVFSSLLAARRFGAANFAIDALNHPDPLSAFRTSVGIEQPVFTGGRLRFAVAAAALRRDLAAIAAEQATGEMAVATTQAFGRLLAVGTNRRAIDAALASAREDVGRAERRRDAGMATEADVLTLAVHVADLDQRRIQAEGEMAVARAELNRLMGAPVEGDVAVVEPALATSDEFKTGAANVSALVAEAEAARPELRRAIRSERLAALGRREARAALIPDIGARAVLDLTGTEFADRASAWVVGGELRWTFSAGGAERARIKAAAEAEARARAELDDVRAAVRVDVISALARLASARARQAAGRAAVEQARESDRIIRNRFDAGIAGVTDLLRASTAVLDAEANRTAALVDAMVSEAQLRRALGRTP